MELGTGLGFLASFCAKRIGSSRVFTFEANPSLEPRIRETFALNSVEPSLEVSAVGNQAGVTWLHVPSDFWGASVVQYRTSRPIAVPMTRFDVHVHRIRPTFLVIDIEGGELDLAPHMDLTGVRKISIELHPLAIGPEGVALVLKGFAERGFRVDRTLSVGDQAFLFRG
jgi:FkbM family methyltransferase